MEPGESVFIDDTPINAEAAQYIGMTAFVFHDDVGELREWLTGICAQTTWIGFSR